MKWYKLKYETLKWESELDYSHLSRSQRSKILDTYQSSIPDTIATKTITLPQDLEARISDLLINLSRFDIIQSEKGYNFPLMLLRSESAASSQIENLTSSIVNISIAEITDKASTNARMIVGNIYAMQNAISIEEKLNLNIIKKIHFYLMKESDLDIAGNIRSSAVWVGGTNYSPHNSIFTPPHFSKLDYLLKDFIEFSNRVDINPIVKAAILHAQFETIHPFLDGNGRVGRALIHKSLKDDDVIKSVSLPISAGLLNNTKNYMQALKYYQEGNPYPIIEELVNAIEIALMIGDIVSKEISNIISKWESKIKERKTSSIYKLIYLLIEHPVVNSMFIAKSLNITIRSANLLIDRAVNYGILKQFGNAKRGILYQASDFIDIFEKVSSNEFIKRYM